MHDLIQRVTKNSFKLGVVYALINTFSLSIVGVIDKYGVSQVSHPLIFSTQSILSGFFFTFVFAAYYLRRDLISNIKKTSAFSWVLIAIIGVFASGLFILCRFIGLSQSTGTFATISQIITTALTALLARFILKERLSRLFWFFFSVILVATYFVSIGELRLMYIKNGDAFILLGTFFLAIANILSKIIVQKVSPVLLSLGRFAFGGFFLFIISTYLAHGLEDAFSIWAGVSGALWFVSVVSFYFALKKIGVTYAVSILMIAPVFTMIIEFIFLHQHFSLLQVIASLIIVVSGIFMIISQK